MSNLPQPKAARTSKFPLATAWLAANTRGDIKTKIQVSLWANDLAAGKPHPNFALWLIKEWSDAYVGTA